MNDKKCKALRKEARLVLVNRPERAILAEPHSKIRKNHPNTVRGYYRTLKKVERKLILRTGLKKTKPKLSIMA
jgi:hypothetical protein